MVLYIYINNYYDIVEDTPLELNLSGKQSV